MGLIIKGTPSQGYLAIFPMILGDMFVFAGIFRWMYPDPNVPLSWEIPINKPYNTWVFTGYNPQESLENTINTIDTLLGVHPIVPYDSTKNKRICIFTWIWGG